MKKHPSNPMLPAHQDHKPRPRAWCQRTRITNPEGTLGASSNKMRGLGRKLFLGFAMLFRFLSGADGEKQARKQACERERCGCAEGLERLTELGSCKTFVSCFNFNNAWRQRVFCGGPPRVDGRLQARNRQLYDTRSLLVLMSEDKSQRP